MKLLGIFSEDFDVIYQLQFRYSVWQYGDSCWANQEVSCCVGKGPCFHKIDPTIILPSSPYSFWLFPSLNAFWSKFYMHLSSPMWHTVFFHLVFLDLITGCLKKTQILKLFIVLFSPFFCFLFCFRSKCFFSTHTL